MIAPAPAELHKGPVEPLFWAAYNEFIRNFRSLVVELFKFWPSTTNGVEIVGCRFRSCRHSRDFLHLPIEVMTCSSGGLDWCQKSVIRQVLELDTIECLPDLTKFLSGCCGKRSSLDEPIAASVKHCGRGCLSVINEMNEDIRFSAEISALLGCSNPNREKNSGCREDGLDYCGPDCPGLRPFAECPNRGEAQLSGCHSMVPQSFLRSMPGRSMPHNCRDC